MKTLVNKIILTHDDVFVRARKLVRRLKESFPGRTVLNIYPIPRGGTPAMYAVSFVAAEMELDIFITSVPDSADACIDDIVDTGATSQRYREKYGIFTYALVERNLESYADKGAWYVFPWEVAAAGEDTSATDIVTRLLEHIGEDPKREGLRDTPARVLKAWGEWTDGYGKDPAAILKTFKDGSDNYNEMVIVHNIPVHSHCEHHLAPITGVAHVGYIPNGRIVGLSKLPRLVQMYAHRLQVQERLATQIAGALQEHLKPHGVGVILRCEHGCMSGRGVKVHGGVPTTTSAMFGALRDDKAARSEFLKLCELAERGTS